MTEAIVLEDFLYYLLEKKVNKTYYLAVRRWVKEYLEMLK